MKGQTYSKDTYSPKTKKYSKDTWPSLNFIIWWKKKIYDTWHHNPTKPTPKISCDWLYGRSDPTHASLFDRTRVLSLYGDCHDPRPWDSWPSSLILEIPVILTLLSTSNRPLFFISFTSAFTACWVIICLVTFFFFVNKKNIYS